ncbi:MAG TPA: phosphatase PAP2 family protein [Vicinamibacteria bacterium]|jgi:undecaprenyl-diphosphatase|nr:phosphatase PAP2 family protein [Vicinamibacteria bacterium]
MNSVLAYVDASDRRISWRLSAWAPPSWLRVWMMWATRLGDGWLWLAAAVLLLAAGGPYRLLLLAATVSAATTNTATVVLKRGLRRRRPSTYGGNPFFGVAPSELFAFDQFSFPSGHTMNAFALGSVLVPALPALAVPVFLVAGSIGVSRVILGLHFLSDVLVGALLGLFIGGTAYAFIVA